MIVASTMLPSRSITSFFSNCSQWNCLPFRSRKIRGQSFFLVMVIGLVDIGFTHGSTETYAVDDGRIIADVRDLPGIEQSVVDHFY